MGESLYITIEGPRGKAEVFQIAAEGPPWDVGWEVRFGGQRQKCSAEGEATIVAAELVGSPDQSLGQRR